MLIIVVIHLSSCQPSYEDTGNAYDFNIIRIADAANDSVSMTEQEGSVDIKTQDASPFNLMYKISGGEPNKVHSVDVTITVHEGSRSAPEISIENPEDINSKFIFSNIEQTKNDTYVIKRLVAFDENGECDLTLLISSHGQFTVHDPLLRRVDTDADYAVYTIVPNVEFIFFKQDLTSHRIDDESIRLMMERLSTLRESIKNLSDNYEPYDKITRYLFTERIPHTALAGNFIYVNRDELEYIFNNPTNSNDRIQKDDPIAVLCHEMSHTFDRVGDTDTLAGYCFDRELFATLKAIYALYINDYDIDYDYLMDAPELSSGVYNYEVLLRKLLESCDLLENNDWLSVKNTLRKLRYPDENSTDNYKKFYEFITVLSQESGNDLYKIFSQEEWLLLNTYFS